MGLNFIRFLRVSQDEKIVPGKVNPAETTVETADPGTGCVKTGAARSFPVK
jgi:hypothetical protein